MNDTKVELTFMVAAAVAIVIALVAFGYAIENSTLTFFSGGN